MAVSAPRALVEKRLQALQLHLPSAMAGEVEGIHQTRVASRRLRELLPILPPSEGHVVARILRRNVRLITRALGPVRELDVSLILLDDMERAGTSAGAIRGVRKALGRQRAEAFRLMRTAVDSVSLERVAEASIMMAGAAGRRVPLRRCRMLLARRLTGRNSLLASAVEAAGLVYAADRIHAVRIAVKKLRYAVEIAQELRGAAAVIALARLRAAQDLLGALHDLQVLARRVRDTKPGAQRRSAQVEELAAELDHRIRVLHGQFLDLRPTLDIAFDRCRTIRDHVSPPPIGSLRRRSARRRVRV